MVVTHSDCADVFVWDFAKQANMQTSKVRPCCQATAVTYPWQEGFQGTGWQ